MIHIPIAKITVGLIPWLWNTFKDELKRERRFTKDEVIKILNEANRLGYGDIDLRDLKFESFENEKT